MALAHLLVLGLGGMMIGIPILLHLLMQPKPKHLMFPALRFVREIRNTNQRSLHLRHWILLVLRCLLILAVVAALARPSTTSAAFGNWLGFGAGGILSFLTGTLFLYAMFWSKPANIPLALVIGAVLALLLAYTTFTGIQALNQNGSTSILADQSAPVASMLIVDSSPRMSYRFENQSRLEKAKQDGRWLIGNLPPGSRVSVVTNDGDKPFFSVDISAARKRLETIDINYTSRTIPETLSQSIGLLAESELERKEIYVLGDLTVNSWIQSSSRLAEQLSDNPDVSLYVMDVGIESPTNYSVGPVALSADSIPVRGQLEIETQLRSLGEGKTLVLKLMLEKPDQTRPRRSDGKTLVPQDHWTRVTNVDVARDSATTAKLTLQDDLAEGIHHGWVEIESSDSLPVDDKRFFTIEVRPNWDVLVVHPTDVDPGRLVDAMGGGGQESSTFNVKIAKQQDLASEPELGKYRAVYLLNPKPMSDPLWKMIEEYVVAGGSLGIFLGHNARAGSAPAASFQTEQATRVLPGSLARIWRSPPRERIVPSERIILSMQQTSHALLKEFRPLGSLGIWQPFPIYRFWEFEDIDASSTETVVRFTNGLPAILERQLGRGKVLCMTTPISDPINPRDRRSWNDLFNDSERDIEAWPAFLLIYEISNYLASGTRENLNIIVGQTVVLDNDLNQYPYDYSMFTPRDEDPSRVESTESTIKYKFTQTPGIYRLKGELDDGKGAVLRGFSANLAETVTQLQRIEDTQLTEILGANRYQLARDRDDLQRQQGTTRMGKEFYPVLALFMSLFLALELVMSNRFYKKAS